MQEVEGIWGFLLMLAGVPMLYRGIKLKEDKNSGIKFRLILTGAAAIFFGFIIMIR
jgi:hypothetical protein